MKRLTTLFFVVSLLLLTTGCSTTRLMPSVHEHTVGDVTWNNYSDAEKFYNQVHVGKSTVADLALLGFHVSTAKNLVILDR